jgi:AraC family transcriptional regulator, transcriptional activator of pobA
MKKRTKASLSFDGLHFYIHHSALIICQNRSLPTAFIRMKTKPPIPMPPIGCCGSTRSSTQDLEVFVSRWEALHSAGTPTTTHHRHDHFECFWLRGPCTHINEGTAYELSAGAEHFVLVRPGQVHAWQHFGEARGYVLSFTVEFFEGREPTPGELLGLGGLQSPPFPPVLCADAALAAELAPLFERALTEFTRRQEHWSQALRALLQLILAGAWRAHRQSEGALPRDKRAPLLVTRFQRLVEQQFRTDHAVASYARRLGVSPDHLRAVAKEGTGQSPGALIRARLMQEARRLLIHTPMQAAEIAYHLGYEDPSLFSRNFRKATGQTPVEYRQARREDQSSGARTGVPTPQAPLPNRDGKCHVKRRTAHEQH